MLKSPKDISHSKTIILICRVWSVATYVMLNADPGYLMDDRLLRDIKECYVILLLYLKVLTE